MPGAYAHFALINQAYTRVDASFSIPVRDALDTFFKFCDLGAVSPDYPYLSPLGGAGKEWADAMHYFHTAQFVRNGVNVIKVLENNDEKLKLIAWILGYASHVVADCVIHPIVNLVVKGDYAEKPLEHCRCEMHQDAYIFNKVMGLQVNAAHYLRSGINFCSFEYNRIDPDLKDVWLEVARQTHSVLFSVVPPEFDRWHRNYIMIIGKFQADIKFIPFSRHIQALSSKIYPSLDEIDQKYIENLETPLGNTLPYDQIFNIAASKIVEQWREIDDAINGNTQTCMANIGEPNLDDGVDKNSGQCVFWI